MIRSTIRTISRAVRATIAPATLFVPRATAAAPVAAAAPAAAPVVAEEPEGLYGPDEMPTDAEITAACLGYDAASDAARSADRARRKHRKLLDRLPASRYAGWEIERVASSRTTVDLDAVRAIFKAHGLGELPTRTPAPTLRVRKVAEVAEVRELVAA